MVVSLLEKHFSLEVDPLAFSGSKEHSDNLVRYIGINVEKLSEGD